MSVEENDTNLSVRIFHSEKLCSKKKKKRSKGDEISGIQNEGQALRKTQWTVMNTEKVETHPQVNTATPRQVKMLMMQ